jgi:REP element-mobilizing transposase RayT
MSLRPQTIAFWRGALPHWEVVDGRYFVTVRLANSLPAHVERELAAILEDATEKDYTARSRIYFRTLERWLDANQGEALLAERQAAEMIADAIAAYERLDLWQVSAYAIMPNHVHLFLRCNTIGLCDIMRRFKHITSRMARTVAAGSPLPAARDATGAVMITAAGMGLPAATLAARDATGAGMITAAGKGLPAATAPAGRALSAPINRTGRFWQREWFDHWSRSPQEDDKIISYIHDNPVRAGLDARFRSWPWLR